MSWIRDHRAVVVLVVAVVLVAVLAMQVPGMLARLAVTPVGPAPLRWQVAGVPLLFDVPPAWRVLPRDQDFDFDRPGLVALGRPATLGERSCSGQGGRTWAAAAGSSVVTGTSTRQVGTDVARSWAAAILGGQVGPVRTGSLVVPGLQSHSERGVSVLVEGRATAPGPCAPSWGSVHVVAVPASTAGSSRLFGVFVLFSGGAGVPGQVLDLILRSVRLP
ncbi:MAG TPA: hypothetical protein VIA06_25510 [Candidatus Dormibacteraeota bacterium]|jgi:hypothetical protein|nr:hypothetical protein [Candidatus Dormibacteraeota bacterium]